MKYLYLIISIVFVTSCRTIPEPIIVTKTVLPQEVIFPSVPEIEGITYNEDETIVYVPESVWMRIAGYMVDVQKTEELYKLFRSE